MDKRRLIGGLGALLILAGLLIAFFVPGGLFNRGTVTQSFGLWTITTPPVSSPWPIVGWVLAAVGAMGIVIAFAMKALRVQ